MHKKKSILAVLAILSVLTLMAALSVPGSAIRFSEIATGGGKSTAHSSSNAAYTELASEIKTLTNGNTDSWVSGDTISATEQFSQDVELASLAPINTDISAAVSTGIEEDNQSNVNAGNEVTEREAVAPTNPSAASTPTQTPTYTSIDSPASTATSDESVFSFISWGDAQYIPYNFSNTANQIKTLNPAFTIFNGDLENWGVTTSEMDPMVSVLKNAALFDQTFMVRGNHDNVLDYSDTAWESYFETAPNIRTLPPGVTNYVSLNSSSDYLTYSFDYGNSRFIGVDVPGDTDLVTSAELSFMDQRLASAEAQGLTHAFLFWHGPIYCTTSDHCNCPTASDSSCTPASIINLINNHPIISATFHGHEHLLSWTRMDSTRLAGLTHSYEQFLTSPSGGYTYNFLLYPERVTYAYMDMEDAQGFARITVDGISFTVSFFKVGEILPVWSSTFTKSTGATQTPSVTPSPTATATLTFTPTATATNTFTPTATNTPLSSTATFTPTSTATRTPTATNTASDTPIPPTATFTPTNTVTNTPVPPTSSFTPTSTATRTPTATNTASNTPIPPTATNTPVPPTSSLTPTSTATRTPTATNTASNTPIPPTTTFTPTNTATNTPVPPSATWTPTATNTATQTPVTPTDTLTPTSTHTPTATATYTSSPTSTATITPGPSPTNTPIPVGPGTYDDPALGFIYSGPWLTYTGPEPFRSTLHYTNALDASVSITIRSRQFLLLYTCNVNRGLMDIYVDNVKINTLNQYSASLTWKCTWNSPSLGEGIHSIRFVNASPNATYYVDIDAIVIPEVVPPITIFTQTATPTPTRTR